MPNKPYTPGQTKPVWGIDATSGPPVCYSTRPRGRWGLGSRKSGPRPGARRGFAGLAAASSRIPGAARGTGTLPGESPGSPASSRACLGAAKAPSWAQLSFHENKTLRPKWRPETRAAPPSLAARALLWPEGRSAALVLGRGAGFGKVEFAKSRVQN